MITSIMLAILSSILAAVGQTNFKMSSEKLKWNVVNLITNKNLMIGLCCHGISTVVFLFALKGGELTMLYPIAAFNYVWTCFIAKKWLGEKMNWMKWLGIILIIIGVGVIV